MKHRDVTASKVSSKRATGLTLSEDATRRASHSRSRSGSLKMAWERAPTSFQRSLVGFSHTPFHPSLQEVSLLSNPTPPSPSLQGMLQTWGDTVEFSQSQHTSVNVMRGEGLKLRGVD